MTVLIVLAMLALLGVTFWLASVILGELVFGIIEDDGPAPSAPYLCIAAAVVIMVYLWLGSLIFA